MKLLEFVALYGLLLMPMGAIIFADFYFYKKLKLIPEWASHSGSLINGAAGWSWFLTLLTCLGLAYFLGIEIYFLGLPVWFLAVRFYIIYRKSYQSRHKINLAS